MAVKKAKKVKKLSKRLTSSDLIDQAIKDYKIDNPDWKQQSRDDLYAIESYIDALLYEKKFKHIAPGYGDYDRDDRSNDELTVERLVFAAIKKMTGRRHGCDIYYDDAFHGYDCMSKVNKPRRHGNGDW